MLSTPPIRNPMQMGQSISVPWTTWFSSVYDILSGNDFTYTAGSGPVVVDTVTGTKYRIKVTSGVLGITPL